GRPESRRRRARGRRERRRRALPDPRPWRREYRPEAGAAPRSAPWRARRRRERRPAWRTRTSRNQHLPGHVIARRRAAEPIEVFHRRNPGTRTERIQIVFGEPFAFPNGTARDQA